jgi:hypothetical protein
VHADPIVNDVWIKTLDTFPDGSPRLQIATGPLVYRVTDTANGKSYDADAGGSALFRFESDGSQTWLVAGPIIVFSRPGRTNLPVGIWVVDGDYTVDSQAGHDTIILIHGTEDSVCDRIA